MPVLPLPLASSISFSLLSAIMNLYALAGSGGGRVRDLRVIRLLRRVADQLDWNLLAAAPGWVHAERSLRSTGDAALLFVAAAIATFFVLLPIALVVGIASRRAKRGNAIAVSLVAMCALGLAAGGMLSPAMNAAVCFGAALLVFGAYAMLASSREWLTRSAMAAIAIAITACAIAPLAKVIIYLTHPAFEPILLACVRNKTWNAPTNRTSRSPFKTRSFTLRTRKWRTPLLSRCAGRMASSARTASAAITATFPRARCGSVRAARSRTAFA
jgi:hypothetical protein